MSEQVVGSLKDRVMRGGAWVIGSFALRQVLRLGSNLILTRLLFPEAFGLMSIVYVLMTGMALLSDFGINESIIQNKRGDEPDFLNTAWTVQILRGILIWLIIIVSAYTLPFLVSLNLVASGSVYADPLLPSILVVYSFSALIQGFSSTKVYLAQRNVQLSRITQIELFSQIIAMIVTVVAAMISHSIWALVAGALVSMLVSTIMEHLWLSGPANRVHWDSVCFKEIFHFGKWVFLFSIVGFFVINGDRLMLGGLLEPSMMGIYSIAMLLFSSGQMLFSMLLSRLVFPAISEIGNSSPEKISHVHSRFQLMADLFLFGAAGFLFIGGNSIINLLYDDRYSAAGSMLSILGLGLIGARHGVVEQLWLATATMRLLFIANISRLIVLFTGIPIGYDLDGLHGALVAIVISFYAGWPVTLYYRLRNGLVNWRYEFIGVPVFMIAALLGDGL